MSHYESLKQIKKNERCLLVFSFIIINFIIISFSFTVNEVPNTSMFLSLMNGSWSGSWSWSRFLSVIFTFSYMLLRGRFSKLRIRNRSRETPSSLQTSKSITHRKLITSSYSNISMSPVFINIRAKTYTPVNSINNKRIISSLRIPEIWSTIAQNYNKSITCLDKSTLYRH
nr:hypothetical protein [Cressdnaviricota sp.]